MAPTKKAQHDASWLTVGNLATRLAPHTAGAWAIRHGAYDFGSYSMLAKELVGWDRIATYDELLLVNDSCLTLIKSTQQRKYDNRFIAVDLRNPDFELLARSFGVRYWRAEQGDLERALGEALAADVPALVEVRPGG